MDHKVGIGINKKKEVMVLSLFSIGLAGDVFPGPIGVSSPVDMLSWQIDLLQFLHLLVVPPLMDDIVVVQHTLVALVALQLHLGHLVVVVGVVELIVALALVLKVLHLPHSHFSLHLGYLRLGRSLTQFFVFDPHVELVEVAGRDIVIEVQQLTLDGLLVSTLRL